jgi:hypothetical protein
MSWRRRARRYTDLRASRPYSDNRDGLPVRAESANFRTYYSLAATPWPMGRSTRHDQHKTRIRRRLAAESVRIWTRWWRVASLSPIDRLVLWPLLGPHRRQS